MHTTVSDRVLHRVRASCNKRRCRYTCSGASRNDRAGGNMNIPRSLAVGRAVLGAMGACVVLGSTVGIANAGGDAIRACVNKSSGAIKIVHAGTACATNQTLLVWNQSGPPGPAGPQGPQGPQGVQGPSGVTDIQVVWSYEMFPGTQVSRAFCPPNTRVTGGGGFSLNGAGLKYSVSDPGRRHKRIRDQRRCVAGGGDRLVGRVRFRGLCVAVASPPRWLWRLVRWVRRSRSVVGGRRCARSPG